MTYREQSFTALQIFLARETTSLASETAFLYSRNNELYLVTNRLRPVTDQTCVTLRLAMVCRR